MDNIDRLVRGMSVEGLVSEMSQCRACKMRSGCNRVVTPTGQGVSPILLIVGEAPGQQEDEQGEPFVGLAGECLREILRQTKVINRTNTLITNTLNCRPPGNKFPKDESASICISKWLNPLIEITKPKLMLLLGNVPLKYVAGMTGITSSRSQWYDIRGIRTMATFHPSYVLRCDGAGDLQGRELFERDVRQVADEVEELLKKEGVTT